MNGAILTRILDREREQSTSEQVLVTLLHVSLATLIITCTVYKLPIYSGSVSDSLSIHRLGSHQNRHLHLFLSLQEETLDTH